MQLSHRKAPAPAAVNESGQSQWEREQQRFYRAVERATQKLENLSAPFAALQLELLEDREFLDCAAQTILRERISAERAVRRAMGCYCLLRLYGEDGLTRERREACQEAVSRLLYLLAQTERVPARRSR